MTQSSAKPFLIAGATLAALLLVAILSLQAQMPTTRPKGYVSDFAGVLTPAARQQLEGLATELDQKAHAQLAIVTVKSLQGRPLEDFTIDLASRWGIGYKGKTHTDDKADRGILLFLAIQDRRSRIEVGYGLEPIITDGRAGSILRSMTPYLRKDDYDSAVLLGAESIASIIAHDTGVSLSGVAVRTRAPQDQPAPISLGKILFILLFLSPLFFIGRRHGPGGFWYGGPYVGGWGGGGFGGGGAGGFGGFGGGGFGGGGASGSW